MNLAEAQDANLEELAAIYRARGSAEIFRALRTQLRQPEKLAAWRALASAQAERTFDLLTHPNESVAIAWMNKRLHRMGLANLKLRAVADPTQPDMTAIDYRRIGPRKWLRYLGGPGVAAAAAFLSLPPSENHSASGYFLQILPALFVGTASVLIELQFAWPWLNNLVWKKVHRFGGLLGARFINVAINFVYGMVLYGFGELGGTVSRVFGGVPPVTVDLHTAASLAFFGGWTFDLALGIFLTDVAQREAEGAIDANTRYTLETSGLILVHGGRVASWVLPPQYAMLPYFAQALFFVQKTVPQWLQTVVAERLDDRETYRWVSPQIAPPLRLGEKLVRAVGSLQLLNLPRLVRERPLGTQSGSHGHGETQAAT